MRKAASDSSDWSIPRLMAMLGIALTCAVWMAASPAGAGRPPDEEKAPEKEKAAHDSSQEAAGEAEKKEYPPQDPSLGAIAGRIVLKGPVPAELSKIDPVPSKDHANCGMSVKSDLIVLSKRQEIKDVVISIDGYTPPAKPAPRTIVLDNKKCLFVPRVQATTVGSQIKLTNSDNFLHNSQGLLAANFNPAIPPGGSVIKPLPKAGWLLVKCSFHPWMTAHVQIFPHELFDVTGADGAYRLVNAPPGEYDIRVWHERLAPVKGTVVRTKVRVEAGKTLDLDLELEAKQ